MTIQELERQLLQLSHTDRQHLATVLSQSLQPVTDDRPDVWKDIQSVSIVSSSEAWNIALQKLDTPSDPKILEHLFQSWEEQDDEQEQKETWEYLRQVLDEDRSSNRPLFP